MAWPFWSGSKFTRRSEAAFRRERQIKEWKRNWKLEMIERGNPGWDDLFPSLFV